MSYDLAVYGARRLSGQELARLVDSVAGLGVEQVDADEVRVVRGKRRVYSFTISGPHEVTSDDLPDQVVPHVLDPIAGWQVLVEGSDPAEIPHAVRFAKKLADAVDGVAYDEQTDEVLGVRKRRVAPPTNSELVRLLVIDWYSPVSAPPAADIWLTLAKRYLPEALPKRYGNHEPYPHRFEPDGDAAFIEAYTKDSVYFSCRALPCRDGGLGKVAHGGYLVDTLTVVADTLNDPRWRNTVRRFVVEFARRRGAILGTGEVLRDHRLTNRGAPGTVYRGESTDALRGEDGLLGLPARPVWWTWLGGEYLSLVGDQLPAGQITTYPEGALFEAAPEPADRDQLAKVPDPIPTGLRAKPIPTEPGVRKSPSVTAADIRPG